MPAPDEEQEKWIRTIFEEQPYLANVYPGKTREIGMIFQIKDGEIEYFNLGVRPIFRGNYTLEREGLYPEDTGLRKTASSAAPAKTTVPRAALSREALL